MASRKTKVPTHRAASLRYLLASAWPLVVLTPLFFAVTRRWDLSLFIAALVFLAYRGFVVRLVLLKPHADSLKAIREGRFEDAVVLCWEQERRFDRQPWLDRHRAWVLLSASRYPLREMARHNRAYALHRAGRDDEARRLLDELVTGSDPLPPSVKLREALSPPQANPPTTAH